MEGFSYFEMQDSIQEYICNRLTKSPCSSIFFGSSFLSQLLGKVKMIFLNDQDYSWKPNAISVCKQAHNLLTEEKRFAKIRI